MNKNKSFILLNENGTEHKFKSIEYKSEDDETFNTIKLAEMKELLNDFNDIHDINKTLSEMVDEQHEIIKKIEENVIIADVEIEKGTMELKKAEKYKKSNILKNGLLITSGLLAISSPFGLLIGTKAGLIAGAVSIISGGGFVFVKKIIK